ncbi:MAG TPA: HDOD domain-containing protein, partial [Gammaproteobacteria bacterium]|nr:HDOD domain-containing protein [Gammaproteobacteria bacterium]
MSEFHVGRQPIYNRELDVFAYELMSHGNEDVTTSAAATDKTTSQVIINAFMEIGIDNIVGKHTAFIKLAERFLTSDMQLPLPPGKVILKIPGYIQVNATVTDAAARLTRAGFKLALDDYLTHKHLQPLAIMASIIDINIEGLDKPALAAHIKILKKLHPTLLVDYVKTYAEYEFCRDLGVDYFQGYFLSRPRIISGEALATNKMSVMNLLATLHNPDTETDAIEQAISHDVSLSYKILKLINSAFFNAPKKIDSIKHAVMMLGRKQLCSWASMMALTGMNDKPREQVRIAMIRAKSCELLAKKAGLKPLDSFFTAGMFSALDLLMDRSLEELISPLPLADNLKLAILNRAGDPGAALNCTLAQETGDWLNIRFAKLTPNELTA